MAEILTGELGTAREARLVRTRPDHEACMVMWLLDTPTIMELRAVGVAEPAPKVGVVVNVPPPVVTRWFCLRLIHLRDLPGVPSAHKEHPGNQWQIGLDVLRPFEGEQMPDPDPDNPMAWKVWGCRWERQWGPLSWTLSRDHGASDQDALAITRRLVEWVLSGMLKLPPDKDSRDTWDMALMRCVDERRAAR